MDVVEPLVEKGPIVGTSDSLGEPPGNHSESTRNHLNRGVGRPGLAQAVELEAEHPPEAADPSYSTTRKADFDTAES